MSFKKNEETEGRCIQFAQMKVTCDPRAWLKQKGRARFQSLCESLKAVAKSI